MALRPLPQKWWWSYHSLLLLLSLIACLAGLTGLYRRLRPEFPQGVTVLTLALIAGATPLIWYSAFDASILDVLGFAIVAWIGVAAGARPSPSPPPRARIAVLGAAAIVPLAVAWLTTASGAILHFGNGRVSDVLFSSWNGFLSWTPAVYLAALGTLAYLRRDRDWAIATLLSVFVTAALIGASSRWSEQQTFGGRALIATLALLAPGLAYGIDACRKRPGLALGPLIAVPLLWNHLLMVQYTVGMLPKDEPVSFARMVRQQADGYAQTWSLYPFSFPANIWFGWRERLPVDRYETLALEPRVPSLDLVMNRAAGRFLLEGWDGMTADGEPPGWWIAGRTATVAVPLALPENRPIRIAVTARSRHEEPTVEAELGLLVNGKELFQFSPSALAASEAEFKLSHRALETLAPFREGFNRITFVSRGNHRVDPGDTRPSGPLARRLGRPAWPVAIYRLVITPE